ncbi:hypothetical protein, partial [Escherichia coli]
IEDPIVIKQILDHLKHKAETSGTRALPESRAPPAELLTFSFSLSAVYLFSVILLSISMNLF